MKFLRCVRLLGLAGLAALGLSLTASVGYAGDKDGTVERPPFPVERANPGSTKQVVDSLPLEVKRSTVKISPDIMPGMRIVYPDESPVGDQVAKGVENSVAAGPCSAWYPVFGPPGVGC